MGNYKFRKTAAAIAGVSAFVIAAGSLAGCAGNRVQTEKEQSSISDTTVKTIKIGYLPITHALAVFEEKKIFEENSSNVQIELVKFSSWSDLTDALNADKIDGASVLIELAMNARSNGIDIKAVALGHKDGNVVVVSNTVNSVADLKGKTFAIPSSQSSHNILLNELLSKNNLKVSDIKVVQLSPTEMPSALASGSIDGYCVAEPFGAQAVATGVGKVLSYSEDIWKDSTCCGLVLNNKFIKENPDATKIFVDKYYEAGNALEDKTEAKSVATQYLGQSEDVLETSLQWIHYDNLKFTEAEYKALSDKMKEYNINENPPSYTDFVYQTN